MEYQLCIFNVQRGSERKSDSQSQTTSQITTVESMGQVNNVVHWWTQTHGPTEMKQELRTLNASWQTQIANVPLNWLPAADTQHWQVWKCFYCSSNQPLTLWRLKCSSSCTAAIDLIQGHKISDCFTVLYCDVWLDLIVWIVALLCLIFSALHFCIDFHCYWCRARSLSHWSPLGLVFIVVLVSRFNVFAFLFDPLATGPCSAALQSSFLGICFFDEMILIIPQLAK